MERRRSRLGPDAGVGILLQTGAVLRQRLSVPPLAIGLIAEALVIARPYRRYRDQRRSNDQPTGVTPGFTAPPAPSIAR